MIRYARIHNEVLKIYRDMAQLTFPIEPEAALVRHPNCKMMTYREFSILNDCSVEETMRLCGSKDGSTHFDVLRGRYLILWNDDPSDNNVPGRQRWTKAHELGHVLLGHLSDEAKERGNSDGFFHWFHREAEDEADLFASLLLCPWALFRQLGIHSPADIMNVFGLSVEASNIRWEDYKRWEFSKRHEKELQWESNMQGLYALRKRSGRLRHPPLRYNGKIYSGILIWPDKVSGDST